MRALVVPIKAFQEAKVRLAPVLDASARHALARSLAEIVLQASIDGPRFVACDDDEVADWSIAKGAQVLWTPGLGLSGAVNAAVWYVARVDVTLAVVAHGDLPFATSFDELGTEGEVTLVPDRHLDGTNVAVVPTGIGFQFSYGPGSFARHCLEAERLGVPLRIVHDEQLACDVDVPADLVYAKTALGNPDGAIFDFFDPSLPRTADPAPIR